jgi:EAL domain-containing protein (putative c-di-GMP-specific phosphodiesterase class I)
MRRRSIVGFEGLSRGWDTRAETLIPAPRLFAAAAGKGLSRELDLLCREKILGEFAVLHEADPELILSVNIEASSAMAKKPWGDYLTMQVAAVGVTPRNVIIEILESVVDDTQELVRFVDRHREAGFLIALDDVGAGHSNLNRIPLIRPDVIKVDRYLVEGLDQDLHKQEVFKSLLSMARHLGTVIVAEGAENEAEVTALLAFGVDMIQGYYFSKPKKRGDLDPKGIHERIGHTGALYRERRLQKAGRKHLNMSLYHELIRGLVGELGHHEAAAFGACLRRVLRPEDPVECLYVLDEEGRQVTEMVFNGSRKSNRKSAMFRALPAGADHSLSDYYYFLRDDGFGKPTYVTKPYISMSTGTLCVTIGARALDSGGRQHIVCLDVQAP